MKKLHIFTTLLLLSVGVNAQMKINVKAQISLAEKQYKLMLKDHPDTTKTVHSANAKGEYIDRPTAWWCSGFFGGSLWYLFQATHKKTWEKSADLWSNAVKKEQFNTHTHDLGFMLYCPFGNGYRLTKNENYKKIMLRGAESLATRFDPEVGVIKSWEKLKNYTYPVIIDNMMNLEFLFWATKASGNKKYYNICLSHADSTMKNHYRPNGSAYHVVCYDKGGKVLAKMNHQGYADESAWTRGQAWGIYGFTVMYRETHLKRYLDHAIKAADYYLNNPNLPADKIPYWDFSAPNIPNEERDASAGAIAASALLELSKYVSGEKKKLYFNDAEKMLVSLSSPAYRSKLGENNNFLIKHCVGAKSLNSEIDVPLVYADYYYLEGLLRYQEMTKKH